MGNTNDESLSATRDAVRVDMKVVGMDQPFFTALALVLGIVSMIFGYMALHQATADEYWLTRSEAFLEQLADQGVHVPRDLTPHREKHP